jgi:rhomboid protease GluP
MQARLDNIPAPRISGMRLPGSVLAVWVLLVLNVLLFLITNLLSAGLSPATGVCAARRVATAYDCALFILGWKDNLLIFLGNEYWRLLTAIFLHGGIAHLLMNSFSLYVVGPDTERVYGTWRFVGVYLLSGIAGSALSYTFSPNPSVGASGAIFGLVGALIVFFYTTRQILGDFGRSQLQGLGAILLINLVFGFTTPGIDNLGHIGGLIGGMIAGWILVPRYIVDQTMFTPRVVRSIKPRDWLGAAALLVVLAVIVVLVTPPPFR